MYKLVYKSYKLQKQIPSQGDTITDPKMNRHVFMPVTFRLFILLSGTFSGLLHWLQLFFVNPEILEGILTDRPQRSHHGLSPQGKKADRPIWWEASSLVFTVIVNLLQLNPQVTKVTFVKKNKNKTKKKTKTERSMVANR